MRILALVIAILGLLIVVSVSRSVAAQQQFLNCNPKLVIIKAHEIKSGDNTQADLKALRALANEIAVAQIACGGRTFTGKGATLAGPFDLPKGVFRAQVYSNESARVSGKVSEGKCGQMEGFTDAFGLYASVRGGRPVDERLVYSEGCKMTLDISSAEGEWVITFEPLE